MSARSGGPKTAGEGGGHLNSISPLDAPAPWKFHFRGHGVSGSYSSSSYIIFGMGAQPSIDMSARLGRRRLLLSMNGVFGIGEEGLALTCPVVARSFVEC